MPRYNLLTIDEQRRQYYCEPCQRYFSSANGARAHCRNANVHQGSWCERCDWLFGSSDALDQHQSASSYHHICYDCDVDFWSSNDLDGHDETVHFMCRECDESFRSARQLNTHKMYNHGSDSDDNQGDEEESQTSDPDDYVHECLGCNTVFECYSSVLMHLESGACTSETKSSDVEDWAFSYYHSDRYTNTWDTYYRFRCPECNQDFRFLSGLISHVENGSCDQDWDNVLRGVTDHIDRMVKARV